MAAREHPRRREDRSSGMRRAPEAPDGDAITSVVRLAPMRRRHLPAVLRIERQVYPRPWTMSLYLGELALPATRDYLVAKVEGRVMGYGGLMTTLDEGHVTTLAVDPALHGHRLGTRLLLELCRRAVLRGATSLTLEVRASNEVAQALYRTFGFAPVGVRKNYYPEVNEDALVMWASDVHEAPYATRLAGIEAALPTPNVLESR
ncbi:MAG: ribosomal protein S18-alanine N-acetyltransferase [Acidimicrobiia bacterium]|nr:ribosomal protein S18-alanine N-acetyltransferase [Acidimicrobiia bacterium]